MARSTSAMAFKWLGILSRGLLMTVGAFTIIGYAFWYNPGLLTWAAGAYLGSEQMARDMKRIGGLELPVPSVNVRFMMWRHGANRHGLATVDAAGAAIHEIALPEGAAGGATPVSMYVKADANEISLWLLDEATDHKAVIDRTTRRIQLSAQSRGAADLADVLRREGLAQTDYIGKLRRPIRPAGAWELRR